MTQDLTSAATCQSGDQNLLSEGLVEPQAPPTSSKRYQTLQDWLASRFSEFDIHINSLPGDASFRRYHRLKLQPKPGQTLASPAQYIVMDAPPEVESILEFVEVDELLSSVVNVPDIIAKDMAKGFLVLQDFGTTEFAHVVADAPTQMVDSYYKKAMDTLLDLQSIPTDQSQLPEYDAQMLIGEMELFSEWFIPYIGITLDNQEHQTWQAFQQAVVAQVLSQPQVVVHRDYHSRNLMVDEGSSRGLGVIDFQDAVIGAYSYDLVSLLRDAYVDWPESQISDWITYYAQSLASSKSVANISQLTAKQLTQDVNIMGIQRHLKVLGIFIRLSERDGKSRYLADIPKVMKDLMYELEWLGDQQAVSPELRLSTQAFKDWLDHKVRPAFEQRFANLQN